MEDCWESLERLRTGNREQGTAYNGKGILPLTYMNSAAEIKALTWKHNALRHTYISARVAECGDVPRVADEAGNSPQVIRTNYLKRIRPAAAAEWFAIAPQPKADK